MLTKVFLFFELSCLGNDIPSLRFYFCYEHITQGVLQIANRKEWGICESESMKTKKLNILKMFSVFFHTTEHTLKKKGGGVKFHFAVNLIAVLDALCFC